MTHDLQSEVRDLRAQVEEATRAKMMFQEQALVCADQRDELLSALEEIANLKGHICGEAEEKARAAIARLRRDDWRAENAYSGLTARS